jgi:hypothetical protein
MSILESLKHFYVPITPGHTAVPMSEPQMVHAARANKILQTYKLYVDASPMGEGKSHIVLALARSWEREIVVICPATCVEMWRDKFMRAYGVAGYVMSYDSLRGTCRYPPSHGLIIGTVEPNKTKLSYKPTLALQQLIDRGVLFVFDECHKLKNGNGCNKAIRCITSAVYAIDENGNETPGIARCAFLSGTLAEKEEQAVHLCKAMGIIRHRNLYRIDIHSNKFELKGLQEMINMCKRFNQSKTDEIVSRYPLDKYHVKNIFLDLFCEVIHDTLFCKMRPSKIPCEMINGFFQLVDPEVSRDQLKMAVSLLKKSARFKGVGMNMEALDVNWGGITKALQRYQINLIPTISRQFGRILGSVQGSKCILFGDYNDALDPFVELVKASGYGFIEIRGKVPPKNRGKLVEQFQKDKKTRIAVCNSDAAGFGISLDDLFGDEPRYCFYLPSYKLITLYQCMKRAVRYTTKSVTHGFLCYAEEGAVLIPVLQALSRKSNMLKKLQSTRYSDGTEETEEDGILMPGDYPQRNVDLDGNLSIPSAPVV